MGNTGGKGQDYTWLNGEITHFDFDAFFQNVTAVNVGPVRDDQRPNSPDQEESSPKRKKRKGARSKKTKKVAARAASEDEGGSQGNRNEDSGEDGPVRQPGGGSKTKKVAARAPSEEEGGQGNRNEDSEEDGPGSRPVGGSKEQAPGTSSNDGGRDTGERQGGEGGEYGADDTEQGGPTSKVARALKPVKRMRRNGDDDDDEDPAHAGSDDEEDPRLKKQRLNYSMLFEPAAAATGDGSDGM